jgi:hypothetical protein
MSDPTALAIELLTRAVEGRDIDEVGKLANDQLRIIRENEPPAPEGAGPASQIFGGMVKVCVILLRLREQETGQTPGQTLQQLAGL